MCAKETNNLGSLFVSLLPKSNPYARLNDDELQAAFATFQDDNKLLDEDGFCRLLDLIRLVDGEEHPLDGELEDRIFRELFGPAKAVESDMFLCRFNLYWCARAELYKQKVYTNRNHHVVVSAPSQSQDKKPVLPLEEVQRIRRKFNALDTEGVGRLRLEQLDEEILSICKPFLGNCAVVDWPKLVKSMNRQ